jgi:hypothetical protein
METARKWILGSCNGVTFWRDDLGYLTIWSVIHPVLLYKYSMISPSTNIYRILINGYKCTVLIRSYLQALWSVTNSSCEIKVVTVEYSLLVDLII